MNQLLAKPARRVVRVETPSRPDLTLYVRAITGAEFLAMGAALNKGEGPAAIWASQMEAYVCDAEGNQLLVAGEGKDFIAAIESADMRRLMKEGEKLNAMSDEAVEAELKN